MGNEAGRAMTIQGARIASKFQFENDVLTLVPSGTHWSDSDTLIQITNRSGAAGKIYWAEQLAYEIFVSLLTISWPKEKTLIKSILKWQAIVGS